MFTGVSGSGKSSLAFSTLYAEAQRRDFESVAPYALEVGVWAKVLSHLRQDDERAPLV
ncbi:hypothetical protein [Pseudomonas sp. GL-B-19]|uniref:hypothetical protein n=1 Tax=Pseudomonas sp. GL-B-19 TaxID=2832393 RepID=UPI001CC1BD66|nr:hypothetical protein [Pseudomonas sp. GL-B-19]